MVLKGNFTSGFAAGAISSVISSSIQGLGKINKHLKDAITIASSGLSGGISSSIAGGNFWRGAKQGVITSGLNHVAHGIAQPGDKYELNGDGSIKHVRGNGKGRAILISNKKSIITDAEILNQLANGPTASVKVMGSKIYKTANYAISNKHRTVKTLFEWIASGNTNEWTYIKANTSSGAKSFIGTMRDGSQGVNPSPGQGGFGEFSIIEHVHSHYGTNLDNLSPSGMDIAYANKIRLKTPNAKFFLYAPLMNQQNYNAAIKGLSWPNGAPRKPLNYDPPKYYPY